MRSGYAETISEPPGASADPMPNPSNGMIRTATAWIRYGAGGAVARSTDGDHLYASRLGPQASCSTAHGPARPSLSVERMAL